MIEAIKISLQFICHYFGLAFVLTIFRYGADDNAQNGPEGDDPDPSDDDNQDGGNDTDGNTTDTDDDNTDTDNGEDAGDTWSDSSSIEQAFIDAYNQSQVIRAFGTYK